MMVLPHLVDAGGDMKKEWYVEYSMRDPYTGEMKRFREYAGINKLPTAEERYALGERMVSAVKEKIAAGWPPYTAKATTYEDNLMLSTVAGRWGNVREGVVNIRTHLSEFLGMKKSEVSPKSYQTYQSKIRIFCEWAEQNGLDKIHVGHITNEHIQDFMRNIAEGKGLSRLTMEKYGQILHSFFRLDDSCEEASEGESRDRPAAHRQGGGPGTEAHTRPRTCPPAGRHEEVRPPAMDCLSIGILLRHPSR